MGADFGPCTPTAGGAEQQALDEALAEKDAVRRVKLLCTPSALSLRVSESERSRGILSAKTLRLAWGLMHVCGVVVIEDLLSLDLVATLAEAQAAHHANISGVAAELAKGAAGSDSRVAVRGSAARTEVRLPMTQPWRSDGLIANGLALALLRLWLGGGVFEIDTFSYIHSAPRSPPQDWHEDVGQLFPSVSICYCCYTPAAATTIVHLLHGVTVTAAVLVTIATMTVLHYHCRIGRAAIRRRTLRRMW